MEGERVNYVEMLIHAFKEMLDGKNPPSIQIDQKQIKLDLNEIEAPIQENIYTPKHLETLLEQHGASEVSSTGAIFTPDNIARMISCHAIDIWLNKGIGRLFPDLMGQEGNESLYEMLLKWVKVKKHTVIKMINAIFENILPNLRILDPCSGGGAFIMANAFRLFRIFIVLFPYRLKNEISIDIDEFTAILEQWTVIETNTPISCNRVALETYRSMNQNDRLSLLQSYISAMNKIIHFIDINRNALEITKIRLDAFIRVLSAGLELSISSNWALSNGDALDTFQVNQIAEYDIILGNPPYIGADNLTKSIPKGKIDQWKQKFRSVIKKGGKPDLYFYFIAQAVSFLRQNGIFCYIIPNRLLSNDYALILRHFLLNSGYLMHIVDFSPSISIFPTANVHPCIVSWQKMQDFHPNFYHATYVSKQEEYFTFSLQNSHLSKINYHLLERFSVFLSQISPETQEILILTTASPQIREFLEIHEGTRLARFQHKFPSHFEFRVPYKTWLSLPLEKKRHYLREIRGKNILRYSLGKPDLALALPELLEENENQYKEVSRSKKYAEPIVYIRELGEKLYAAYEDNSEWGSVGYGGVYFFGIHDLSMKKIQEISEIEPNQCLLALCAYMCSDLFVFLYRSLYAAGAWGTALKFRSSYLHQIPIIDFNWHILYLLGKILHFLSKTGANGNQSLIYYFEDLVNLILVGNLLNRTQNSEISPKSKYYALTEEIQQIFNQFVDPLGNLNSFDNAFILRIQETIESQEKIGQLKKAIKLHPFWKSIVANV